MPQMIFTSVDLPAPFSPSSACTSPARRLKFTPSGACTPGKLLEMSVRTKSGSSKRSLRRFECFSAVRDLDLLAAGQERFVFDELELADHRLDRQRIVEAFQREEMLLGKALDADAVAV